MQKMHLFHPYIVKLLIPSITLLSEFAMCEEEQVDVLHIIPQADMLTAGLNEQISRGITASEGTIVADRIRTRFAPGESVILTLKGKDVIMGNPNLIKWEILSGSDNITIISPRPIGKSITAKINTFIQNPNNTIIIKVTTEYEFSTSITLTPVLPDKNLKGIIKSSYHSNNETNTSNIEISHPTSVWIDKTELLVTITPTDVNFSKLYVIEKDAGIIGNPPSEYATPHTPNTTPIRITDRNLFGDVLSAQPRSIELFNRTGLPQTWAWDCLWKTTESATNLNGNEINHFHQYFKYTWIPGATESYKGARAAIEKFDCIVSCENKYLNK